ncbi:MAG: acyltransferase family protein, partial [Candidatus Dormibacteraeota bacterium]|nr:acyltransferase family protein [Candidatus Dormibacteraeota bacterium]
SLLRFWRRRYLLVVVPYVVWSAIYFIADAVPLHPLSGALRTFGFDLLTGGARYHLYFLLITMQMYLVFPLVMAVIRWTRGFHWLVFLLALAYQLLFTQAHHAGWHLPPVLAFWLQYPDALLPSYVLYIVAGALLADHLEGGLALVRRWWPLAALIAVAGTALALGVYWYAINHLGQAPTEAAEVFQPALTIESLTATLGLLTLGVGWEALLRPRWLRALISDGADSSFGIFLAHPLVLQAIVVVLTSLGILRAMTNLRFSAALGVAVMLVTPAVLFLTWFIVFLLRRSPLSMPLTGRQWRRPPRAQTRSLSFFRVGSGLTAGAGSVMVALLVVVSLLAVNVNAQKELASSGVPNPTKTAPPQPTPSNTPPPPPGMQLQSVTVTSGGQQRGYQVLEPTAPVSSSLPVIVFLHGLDATIQTEQARDGLTPYVTAGEAILVYPVAEDEEWDTGEDTRSAGVNDLAFLTTVLQQAATLPNANPHRVYLAGFSRGGKMAWDLACSVPTLIAGLTIIAATPVTPCATPGPPMSLLQMAGTADPQVAYSDVTREVASWAQKDGCAPNPSSNNGSPDLTTYSGCTAGTKVVLATYQGETHVWPGGNGEALPGPIVWNFFSSLA